MTTATATLKAAPAPRMTWKQILRRSFELLGKHYAYGPYML